MPARPNRPGTNPPEDPAKRSETMRRVRSGDTTPELRVRALLTALGYRYRIRVKSLPGSPDVVFTARRKAVFVHGCFWHGHDCRAGRNRPAANRAYWEAKLARVMARDARNLEELRAMGWEALVVWECELRRKGLARVEEKLRTFLGPPRYDSGKAGRKSGPENSNQGGSS